VDLYCLCSRDFAALPELVDSVDSAAWAVVIFALHPLQTEAVAYVFARATLLAALLCLCSRDFAALPELVDSVDSAFG
jgi:hypothetical protein